MRRTSLMSGLICAAGLGIASSALAESVAPETPAPAEATPAAPAPAPPQDPPAPATGSGGTSPLPDASSSAGSPAAPDVEKRLRELEETVRKQNEIIKRLEETVDVLRKPGTAPGQPGQPGQPAPANTPPGSQPKQPTTAPDGFGIQGANAGFRLRLRGFLQTDARIFPSKGGRTGVESFLVRRARPILTGTVGRYAEFTLQPIFDEGRAGILDAFVDVRQAPQLQFRFGLFKTPYSLERLQSGADLQFIERSIAQNLAPNRDTGFMVHGDTLKGRLSYAAAVLNGAPDAGNIYGDAGRDKDFAGRIFARPFLERNGSFFQGLGLGLAATYGTRDEPFQSTFRTAAREPFFTYRGGTTYGGEVVRLAPQFYHYYRQFGLMGEAYLTREAVRRAGVTTPLENHGWFLQGSYVVTGENATFRSVVPRRPFDPRRGHWGAVELALRYSQFRADQDAFSRDLADPRVAARRADAWTFGVNWYLNTSLKFQLNYERTDFNAPLTFGTGQRSREDVILTRFQLVY